MTISSSQDHPGTADVAVVIVAAGTGTRFGADKTQIRLGNKPLWRWSYEAFAANPNVREIILVGPGPFEESLKRVDGGETRQDSVRRGIDAVSPDIETILVHDAARPFVSEEVIEAVIAGCREIGAAAPVIPVIDTLRSSLEVIDRTKLVAMQTPQGATAKLMRKAHANVLDNFTDEIAILEAIGANWKQVSGSQRNFKVTVPEDLARARAMLQHETRTGLGYDIHAFSNAQERELWLGGVYFPGETALEGHSDADVILHAITDALLGAAVLGDIGLHFPPSDIRWKGEPSITFLKHAASLLATDGWQIVHIDAAVIAEKPKIMPRALDIREAISAALGLGCDRVSVKATTNEGLGSLGRAEGIAAYATATIDRWS